MKVKEVQYFLQKFIDQGGSKNARVLFPGAEMGYHTIKSIKQENCLKLGNMNIPGFGDWDDDPDGQVCLVMSPEELK